MGGGAVPSMGDAAAAERRVGSGRKWFVLPLQLLLIHVGEDTAPSGQSEPFLLGLRIAPKICFSLEMPTAASPLPQH